MTHVDQSIAPSPKCHTETPPLRILHILEATLGGTLRYLENIAESMKLSPFHFGFAFAQERADSRLLPFLELIATQGWTAYPVDMRREVSLQNDWRAFSDLRKIIKAFDADIVHCHSSKAGVLGRFAAHTVLPRPAVLYSPHALAAPLGKKYLYVERALKGLVDKFLAVSKGEAEDIVRYGVGTQEQIHVAYPAIDPTYFSPRKRQDAKLALGMDEAPLILGLGRLTSQKNPLSFLNIVRQIRCSVPHVRAIWIGAGDLTEEFMNKRTELDLAQTVELISWQHDVRPYLAAADVLLSTSLYESFGYMVADALAMEVPVVAPAVSGPQDILTDGLANHLYRPADDETAATLVTELLTNSVYAHERGRLGRDVIMARFSSLAMHNALSACYQTMAP